MEFTTKQMMVGLSLDRITIYRWKNGEAMPTERKGANLYYTKKSLDWILINKPKYKAQVENMINNYAESEGSNE